MSHQITLDACVLLRNNLIFFIDKVLSIFIRNEQSSIVEPVSWNEFDLWIYLCVPIPITCKGRLCSLIDNPYLPRLLNQIRNMFSVSFICSWVFKIHIYIKHMSLHRCECFIPDAKDKLRKNCRKFHGASENN